MQANPLRGQVGGGWALEIETFLGPVKWHRAVRAGAIWGSKKSKCTGTYQSEIHWFYVNELPRLTLTGYKALS